MRRLACSAVSTPSTIVWIPSASLIATIAATSDSEGPESPSVMSATKLWSIFRTLTGRRCR